jgi:uroporphyrinogen III methyltransferase / synthase
MTLAGVSVVITRAREQASELAVLLQAAGARVIELPLIELRDPENWQPVDDAVARLHTYRWILFTSANSVRYFGTRLTGEVSNIPARVCCIGPKTREVAEKAGWRVDLVPREYVAESVAEAFAAEDLAGARILLPRAAVARDLVPQALRERGAQVDIVDVYRNIIPEDAARNANAVFGESVKPDWIAFTSSSTVKNLLACVSRESLENVKIASIGPVTSETARKHALHIDVEAMPHTMEGLVNAIANKTAG